MPQETAPSGYRFSTRAFPRRCPPARTPPRRPMPPTSANDPAAIADGVGEESRPSKRSGRPKRPAGTACPSPASPRTQATPARRTPPAWPARAPQHAGALEHAQDGEGARSRSSQEKIACREHVEHAPPRPSSSPATPHCRNAAIHWYYSTARTKRTTKGRGFGMLRHTKSKHAVVVLSAAPKVRSRRIPRSVSWKSHAIAARGSFDSLRSLRMIAWGVSLAQDGEGGAS